MYNRYISSKKLVIFKILKMPREADVLSWRDVYTRFIKVQSVVLESKIDSLLIIPGVDGIYHLIFNIY